MNANSKRLRLPKVEMTRINLRWFSLLMLFTILSCQQNKMNGQRKNVLLICVDDLRPELNSFGAHYISSPNIDKLAAMGRSFHRHYVNAPSCGPSRYTMLAGQYGIQYRRDNNESLFARAEDIRKHSTQISPSMPEWFMHHGYTTVSIGKVSHHPGGRGGEDWDNDSISEMPGAWDSHIMPVGAWQHPRGAMHGLAFGKIRTEEDREIMESVDDEDSSYPDGLIVESTLQQLEDLAASKRPFFLAVGIIKPHLPFGVPKKYLDLYEDVEIPAALHPEKPIGETTWHGSSEFMSYHRQDNRDPREDSEYALQLKKYYAACVSYADKLVGDILTKLKETEADKNTIVVLWGDHGWHLGEHAIWGKHSLFEESLLSPLIIYDPDMEKKGQKSQAVVETVDIFPTLVDLCELPKPDYLHGMSLLPIIRDPEASGHTAVAYTSKAATIRTDSYRFTQLQNGAVELYDHVSADGESHNIAGQHPEMVEELRKQLNDRLMGKAFDW